MTALDEIAAERRPLNGMKTHPLTPVAVAALRRLVCRWVPRQEINAGVVDRLERGGLIEEMDRPSPYRTHKTGRMVRHVTASAAGVAEIERLDRAAQETPDAG